MNPSAFRFHDQFPPRVTSSLYRELIGEWIQLNTLTSTRVSLQVWGNQEPDLQGFTRLGDLVDAIDAAETTQKDRMLLALIRLTQTGHHQLAGRVLLQTVMPSLARTARRVWLKNPASATGADDRLYLTRDRADDWAEEREHIVVSEFWDVASGYPVTTRTHKVWAQLALDTLNRLTRQRDRAQRVMENEYVHGGVTSDIPVTGSSDRARGLGVLADWEAVENGSYGRVQQMGRKRYLGPQPWQDDTTGHELGKPLRDLPLRDLLDWAKQQQALTRSEADLLAQVYLPRPDGQGEQWPSTDAVAHELGLNPAALRKRCSRARARLAQAVQASQSEAPMALTA